MSKFVKKESAVLTFTYKTNSALYPLFYVRDCNNDEDIQLELLMMKDKDVSTISVCRNFNSWQELGAYKDNVMYMLGLTDEEPDEKVKEWFANKQVNDEEYFRGGRVKNLYNKYGI